MDCPRHYHEETLLLVNAALVGVPAAYAASGSIIATALAGAAAAFVAVARARRRR
ncbi:MAG TPA: hypothetical protein VES42_04180 [Pilimelia sp.]|nr:hypothetical protein [Pilimelia sp.]